MTPQRLTLSKSPLFNQQGFTLLEALVALVIFALVILGSGVVLSQMFRSQKDMLISSTIVDQLQARVQGAVGTPSAATNLCGSITTTPLSVVGTTYYVGCSLQSSATGYTTVATSTASATSITVQWPVLAVSNVSSANAATCAANPSTATSDCYIVGK